MTPLSEHADHTGLFPDFSNLLTRKWKLVRKIKVFEKMGGDGRGGYNLAKAIISLNKSRYLVNSFHGNFLRSKSDRFMLKMHFLTLRGC